MLSEERIKEAEMWWIEFKRSNLDKKIQLVIDICNLKKDKDFYDDFEIYDAINDIKIGLTENQKSKEYLRLLEKIKQDYPSCFNVSVSLFIRDLIYGYSKSNPEKVWELVKYLINNPDDDPDILGELVDFLIINGFLNAAKEILVFYYPFLKKTGNTTPIGLYELANILSFFIIAKHFQCKNEEEALNSIKKDFLDLNIKPDDKILIEKLAIVLNKNYQYIKWKPSNLKKINNLIILNLEFAKYLMENNFNPVLAQFFQDCSLNYFLESKKSILEFDKKEVEKCLASWCNFFSVRTTRAFAILYSLFLFYKFIFKRKLISENKYKLIESDLEELKNKLFKALENESERYKYLNILIKDYED